MDTFKNRALPFLQGHPCKCSLFFSFLFLGHHIQFKLKFFICASDAWLLCFSFLVCCFTFGCFTDVLVVTGMPNFPGYFSSEVPSLASRHIPCSNELRDGAVDFPHREVRSLLFTFSALELHKVSVSLLKLIIFLLAGKSITAWVIWLGQCFGYWGSF